MHKKLLEQLRSIVGSQRLLQEESQKAYASSDQATNVNACLPFLVVKVQSVNELIAVTQTCISFRRPLVVRASGTGKSGGAVPGSSFVVIDISALNKIISIDSANLTAELEPGVILGVFQAKLKKLGLFYPPDPASKDICSIGGNVAENAGGPSTLKYGVTRDYVLGGQAVLGTGEVIDFGKRCPKGVAGYDIGSILCGSEGTLAVITKIRLRLLPLPQDLACALFLFANDSDALKAIPQIFAQGHVPKILEYFDGICIQALQKQGLLKSVPKENAALLVECDASFKDGGRTQLLAIQSGLSVAPEHIIWAYSKREQTKLRSMREGLSKALTQLLGLKISEDIAIPIAKLADFRSWFLAQGRIFSLTSALFGHAGDGNLHVQILFAKEADKKRAQALRHEVLLQVLKLGGTLSAEHGIGLQKKAYLPLEQSDALINLQKRIKQAFDPHNILNPGKIFDSEALNINEPSQLLK